MPVNLPAILLITVNYKGSGSTEVLLKSASKLQGFSRVHLIVVENGSGDGSAEKLRPIVEQLDNVELLESAQNLGYFGAANWGLKQYCSGAEMPEWVIVCNHDITFDDPQFVLNLLQRNPASAQVIAPAIVARTTGIDCNPMLRHRPSRFKLWRYRAWNYNYHCMRFKHWLSPYVRRTRHRLYWWRRRSNLAGPTPVYAAHGAFLIFNRSYFDAGGYIDDGFFLYYEEFSVAEICRRLGLTIVYDPTLQVWHAAHQSTGSTCTRTMFEHGRQGLEYALQRYLLVSHSTPATRDLSR
jgi:GT2 family glycosyltransferase